MSSDPIVIVGGARTPMGGFQGELQDVTSPELGAIAIKGAVERAGILPDDVEEVIMGCVLPAGCRQVPARQASMEAGIPENAGCTTINKACGSGMKAVMLANDLLRAETNDVMVAGGMESMTNAPYLLMKARGGYRMGHGEIYDHMFCDGLQDPFKGGDNLMGVFAENTTEKYQFTRESQDAFAITSLKRARTAGEDGTFDREVSKVTVKTKNGETVVALDEQPRIANLEKIPQLKPAFRKDGTVTPANSSSISDGAAAVVMMRLSEAEKRGLTPWAKILAHATHSQDPAWFTTAPVYAMQKLLDKVNWDVKDVDLYEVNEAFAVVTMVAMKEFDLPHDKVNIHGGACALGHPIGASGCRILVTLLNALEKHDLDRGVASLCIGGGEATALAVERLH